MQQHVLLYPGQSAGIGRLDDVALPERAVQEGDGPVGRLGFDFSPIEGLQPIGIGRLSAFQRHVDDALVGARAEEAHGLRAVELEQVLRHGEGPLHGARPFEVFVAIVHHQVEFSQERFARFAPVARRRGGIVLDVIRHELHVLGAVSVSDRPLGGNFVLTAAHRLDLRGREVEDRARQDIRSQWVVIALGANRQVIFSFGEIGLLQLAVRFLFEPIRPDDVWITSSEITHFGHKLSLRRFLLLRNDLYRRNSPEFNHPLELRLHFSYKEIRGIAFLRGIIFVPVERKFTPGALLQPIRTGLFNYRGERIGSGILRPAGFLNRKTIGVSVLQGVRAGPLSLQIAVAFCHEFVSVGLIKGKELQWRATVFVYINNNGNTVFATLLKNHIRVVVEFVICS